MAPARKTPRYNFDPARSDKSKKEICISGPPHEVREELQKTESRKTGFILDTTAPIETPRYKVGWGCSYAVKITSDLESIDLNKTSFLQSMAQKILNPSTLSDVEIHVLWISFLPSNLIKGSVKLGLEFTQAADYEISELQSCTFPGYQPTHCILYPGHSIFLRSQNIPWAITVDCSEIPVKEEYVLAKMYIKITGYNSEIPPYARETVPRIIAMVPLDEPAAGVSYSRPRAATTSWRLGFVKRAIQSKEEQKKILALQQIGVDVEGLSLLKKLSSVLKGISAEDLKTLEEEQTKHKIARHIKGHLAGNK